MVDDETTTPRRDGVEQPIEPDEVPENGAEPTRSGLGEFDTDEVRDEDLPGDHPDVDVTEGEPDLPDEGPDINSLPDDVFVGHPDPDEDGIEPEYGGEG